MRNLSALTPAEKIKVLEEAKKSMHKYMLRGEYVGLCFFTQQAIDDVFNIFVNYSNLPEIIPEIFVDKKPKNNHEYWFGYNHQGYLKRLNILNETIEELKTK